MLLLGCGGPTDEICGCDCQTNPDGTLNFGVNIIDTTTMVIKVNGEAYLKTRIDALKGPHKTSDLYGYWKNLKNAKTISNDGQIESLEACSLLYFWKQKGLYQMVADTSAVRLVTDSVP